MMLTIYKPSNTKHCMTSHTRCIFFGSTFITSPVRNVETPMPFSSINTKSHSLGNTQRVTLHTFASNYT